MVKKNQGIYGSASKEDLKELNEEGIDAQMIPGGQSTISSNKLCYIIYR